MGTTIATMRGLIFNFFEELGRCPKCMRKSFVFALGTCGLALLMAFTASPPALRVAVEIAALAAAGVWLSHLLAFAFRASRRRAGSPGPQTQEPSPADTENQGRRRLILSFARNFAFIAVATALPIASAWAASCPCAATLKCCWNYTADTYTCAPRDAVCCGHPTTPWYCQPKHNCYGDKGGCR